MWNPFRRKKPLTLESSVIEPGKGVERGGTESAHLEAGQPDDDPEFVSFQAIAALIFAEARVEEIQRGRPYTDEERAVIHDAKARKMAADYVAAQQNLKALHDMRDVLDRIADGAERVPHLLQQQIELQPARQLQRLWQEHPFLMGFLGADLVHRINDRLERRQ